ncbi:flagellar hook-associated protein FlgL [Bacillus solitudinis]|uniref:flagellar hook-associated protein FlgL n=1 Tax=Bacillus solitudinis TaxID=2014074 RepID=UPI000C240314|nr:flagellar hook-associated protein FlgL [Bacillus solitudinis]
MRVTQMMLSTSTLRHISQGYNRLSVVQDQLSTGKKIVRASQDPVVAMKGMRYRSQVTEVEQFQRNLREVYNWMDTADSTLGEATDSLARIRELATQASNDTYEGTQRANVAKEVKQLREHLQSLANTKNSTKFIFNGTDTTNPPIIDMEKMDKGITALFEAGANLDSMDVTYAGKTFRVVNDDGAGTLTFQDVRQTVPAFGDANFDEEAVQLKITNDSVTFSEKNKNPNESAPVTKSVRTDDVIVSDRDAVSANTQTVEIELLKGVSIPVNVNPASVFSNALFGDIIRLERALENPEITGKELTSYIDDFYGHIDQFVAERAELGARVNRVEMIENRLMQQDVNAKRIMSDNEDVDMEKVIIDLTIQESVHRAALASGARIMQPTLMDFLR